MSYLMAGQLSEIERLRLQSRVWQPAGERLLTSLGDASGQRVLEVGCGVMGWLGCLSVLAPFVIGHTLPGSWRSISHFYERIAKGAGKAVFPSA